MIMRYRCTPKRVSSYMFHDYNHLMNLDHVNIAQLQTQLLEDLVCGVGGSQQKLFERVRSNVCPSSDVGLGLES